MSSSTHLLLVRLAVVWMLLVTAVAADEPLKVDLIQDLPWTKSHFAMTNWFYAYKSTPAEQIRILKQSGHDSALLSLKADEERWKQLPAYLAAMREHGVRLAGIHTAVVIEDGTYPKVVKDNLPLLKGSNALLVPSVASKTKKPQTDPETLQQAAKILREMSDDCVKYGLGGVAMYTHVDNWVETLDDALRVAVAADRRNVGTIFHLYHWQAKGGRDLAADLRRARPYLLCVIIQGTDKDRAVHKVLGEGSFDLSPLVRTLREMGYHGPLGTMGYSQSGDIPAKLARSRQAWERMKVDKKP